MLLALVEAILDGRPLGIDHHFLSAHAHELLGAVCRSRSPAVAHVVFVRMAATIAGPPVSLSALQWLRAFPFLMLDGSTRTTANFS